jgi:hypothetical protein
VKKRREKYNNIKKISPLSILSSAVLYLPLEEKEIKKKRCVIGF